MKKKWRKPEFIELYRGTPDENLLAVVYCKAGVAGRNDPDNAAGIFCEWEHGARAGEACHTYQIS